jgi:hypothetical protein
VAGSTFGRAAAALVVALAVAAPAAATPDPAGVVVEGLTNPRGLDALGGRGVLVAESGTGELKLVQPRRTGAPRVTTFATLPVDEESGNGPVDVASKGLAKTWVVMSGPTEAAGDPFAELVRLNRKGKVNLRLDIAGYQEGDPDPFDVEDFPTESNPNGLALLRGGGVLLTDAAGNDLLRVSTGKRITTVARFKTELAPWPDGLPFPGPPPGTPVPVESVPTAVAIGPDGAWYVSELKGFPFPKGASRIWRIEPGTTNAVCDPESPDTGPCRTVASGFTSVIDLAFGPDGTMYVLEIVKEGLLGVEIFGDPPIGALWAVKGGTKTELVPGELLFPGGVDVNFDGSLYVTTGSVFGPGAGTLVRVNP